ncbi:MAG: cation:proton antiporter, partial [Phycisphaeraceae bacterium]|nr:cation:proton antiporter [Phycisphaeraceae bacterium]
ELYVAHGPVLLPVARLTLAIGVMGVALRVEPDFYRQHWRALAMVLGPLMVAMWATSSFLGWLILGLAPAIAILVGACLTPTDPVLASSIVTGSLAEKHLPQPLRRLLSAESGANDGLAILFVLLPLLVVSGGEGSGWGKWFVEGLGRHVGLALLVGLVAGSLAGKALDWACSRDAILETSYLVFSLALTLLVLAVCRLLEASGILAVFVAGVAFSLTTTRQERLGEERVQEAFNRLLLVPVFVLLGVGLPFEHWRSLGWAGIGFVAAVLVARRWPWVLLLRPGLKPVREWPEAMFYGWFGPIGIAALVYGCDAAIRQDDETIWHLVSLVVVASVVAHGITAAPWTRWMETDGAGDVEPSEDQSPVNTPATSG